MKTIKNYTAPEVTICEVAIEVGFAGSGETEAVTFGFATRDDNDMDEF